MTFFTVRWEMPLDAESATDAARKALAVHRNPESIATVFQVTDDAGVTVEVDLADACDACEDSRVPGVLHGPIGPALPSGTVMIHDIQGCGNCERFEGDLDAAFALSTVTGGRVFFYQSDGIDDDPEEDNEVREFTGTHPDPDIGDDNDDLIAMGTDPWIRIDPSPGPTGQEGSA